MRRVKLTFITTIPDADTDDQAYLMADREVSLLDPPSDWEFVGMEVKRSAVTIRKRDNDQIRITDYDSDGNLVRERFEEPRAKGPK